MRIFIFRLQNLYLAVKWNGTSNWVNCFGNLYEESCLRHNGSAIPSNSAMDMQPGNPNLLISLRLYDMFSPGHDDSVIHYDDAMGHIANAHLKSELRYERFPKGINKVVATRKRVLCTV